MKGLKPLDHGILNLPLNKRMGNTEKDIKEYKTKQRKEQEDRLFLRKEELRKQAELVRPLTDKIPEIAKAIKKIDGGSLPEIRMNLKLESKYHPARFIKICKGVGFELP